MNHNKLYILCYLDRHKLNKNDKCPIKCRITYRKKRKQFSTGLFINPDHWNIIVQRVTDDSENSEYTNTQLGLIINKMNQAFLLLQVQESSFTVEDIYALYKGKKLKKETILCSTLKCS